MYVFVFRTRIKIIMTQFLSLEVEGTLVLPFFLVPWSRISVLEPLPP